MTERLDTILAGAGPYGLSLAAHLRAPARFAHRRRAHA